MAGEITKNNTLSDKLAATSEDAAAKQVQVIRKLIRDMAKELDKISDKASAKASKFYTEIEDLETDLQNNRLSALVTDSEARKKALKVERAYEDKLIADALERNDSKALIGVKKLQQNRLKQLKEEYASREKLQLKYEAQLELNAEAIAEYKKELATKQTEAEIQAFKEANADLENLLQSAAKNANVLAANKSDVEASDERLLANLYEQMMVAEDSGDAELMREVADAWKELAGDMSLSEEARAEAAKQAEDAKKAAAVAESREKNAAIKAELKHRLTTLDGIKDTLADGMNLMTKGLSKMFDNLEEPINSFYEYQAKYQARLQGSENDYAKMMKNINKQIGLSPFVKQTKMVENIQKLIDSGINYNVELRAYLASVSENIASTFDAFDSNLLRLIRIQQSDSTAARLGMESALNNFLNSMFSDSSYLGNGGSGLADTVAGALLDASAQLTHQGAAEMEFAAQKWLGALYSMGVSDDAISSIAGGLGALGSGNIEQLSGNEALMSLFAMSANKGGISISSILNNGLTADNTNKLLEGMVKYLSEIASNTDSTNVTKSAIAQVFGLSNTDLRSINNLTASDIRDISNTTLNYSQALAQTASELKAISTRTHLSQIINNVIDNAKTGSALNIGSNAGTYGLYKALNLVSGLVGDRGLEIPGIQAFGTGTASGIDILSIAKAGVAGTALLSSLISSLGNIGSGGLPALSAWAGYEQSLQRGQAIDFAKKTGVQSGYSENATYSSKGSSSTSDMGSAAMQESTDMARENQSDEDRESADDAKKYYKEGLPYLATIAASTQELVTKAQSLAEIMQSPLTSYSSSSSAFERITQLSGATAAAAQAVRVSVINDDPLPVQIIHNESDEPTSMRLTSISEEVSTKLNQALRAIILSSFADETLDPETGVTSSALMDQIKNILSGLNVHIDNDFFDESLQRSAFGGI